MLTLHNKDFTTKYGTINTTIEAFVEEERNGLFELSFIMLNTDSLFNYVKEDNIVVANANDTLLNQKFRIYMTRKLMNNRVEVFARHISFDLMYDYVDSINFENQSCEYALNMLFRNSNFSKHYKGYSDIINAQDYNMSMANILEAIGGKEGSIIDTYGTGAELLRDNENIHVLNKRGYDNSVSIEYKKNLTGFELEEDTTELITRILPYAKYNDEENGEVVIKANYVDSPLIANYSHPFIKAIDYSDKFDDENIPAADKLRALAGLEYKNNKVDMPKQNFKIEFIPLSKCVGYEGLSDNISICDTVTIKDTRYNINTQAKVIKVTFNVLKNRYESMELGEPKTSLGDIIGNNNSSKGEKGDKGDKGEPGKDGSIGDFPNSLPSTPVVTAKVYGFANIEISWTFENKVYYQYEVYASKEADFVPNTFNLIHQGQTSTYMYQAKPGETWHFKVCCINSHGERTDFGSAYATTTKIDDLSNYVGEMAIGEALIGTLSLDRGWVGELKGNYINAKNLSVTNGNGKRTLDIDSFGNVNIQASNISMIVDGEEQGLITRSELEQTKESFDFKFTKTGAYNLLYNGSPLPSNYKGWSPTNAQFYTSDETKLGIVPNNAGSGGITSEIISVITKKELSFKGFVNAESNTKGFTIYVDGYLSKADNEANWRLELFRTTNGNNQDIEINQSFVVPNHIKYLRLVLVHNGIYDFNNNNYRILFFTKFQLVEGQNNFPMWSPCPDELYNSSTHITPQGLTVYDGKINIINEEGNEIFWVDNTGRLSTDNIFIYGSDNTGNLNVSGTGNKGVGIRSLDGRDRYIDFTSVEFDTNFTDSVSSGNHVRLLARGGKLLLLPTTSLEIGSVDDTKKLNTVYISADDTTLNGELEVTGLIHALGNVNIEGTNYNTTARIRNLAGYSDNQEAIVVHSPLQCNAGIVYPSLLSENINILQDENLTSLDKISLVDIVNDRIYPKKGKEDVLSGYIKSTDESVNLNIHSTISLLWGAMQDLKKESNDLKLKLERLENNREYNLIEKARNNIVIANNSINIDSEDIKEPVKATIENEINKDLIK